MRFRFSGFGRSFATPLVVYFEAETVEAARHAALRVLTDMPECEQAEVVGDGQVIELACETRRSAA